EVLALVEDGEPAQTRLKTLETQLLEQAAIVVDGESPFGIVITLVFGRGRAPRTAHFAVGPGDGSAHANGALCQSRCELSGRFETDVEQVPQRPCVGLRHAPIEWRRRAGRRPR